jgi:phospholipid transport system substrate-binding protein
MIRFVPVFKLLVSLVYLVSAWPAGATADSPSAVVEGFHGNLLAVMKDADALGVAGRYQRLESPVASAFDLQRMIRVACGSYCKNVTPAKRQALLDGFTRMSVGTYAAQFDGFSGEAFETLGESPGPQGTILVKTRIVRPDDSPVGLTYVLKEVAGGWRIADVLLDDSISQLAVRRSEYRRVLRKDGVDGLVSVLNRKADQLSVE